MNPQSSETSPKPESRKLSPAKRLLVGALAIATTVGGGLGISRLESGSDSRLVPNSTPLEPKPTVESTTTTTEQLEAVAPSEAPPAPVNPAETNPAPVNQGSGRNTKPKDKIPTKIAPSAGGGSGEIPTVIVPNDDGSGRIDREETPTFIVPYIPPPNDDNNGYNSDNEYRGETPPTTTTPPSP